MVFKKINQLETSRSILVPRDQLSPKQVEFYREQGYLIVEEVITPDEIESLHQDLIKMARGGYPSKTLKPLPESISDREALENLLCIHQPHKISPVVLEMVKHQKICGMVSQLAGAHLPHWDGSTKCFQSLYFVKPPGFPGQAWHQDEGLCANPG